MKNYYKNELCKYLEKNCNNQWDDYYVYNIGCYAFYYNDSLELLNICKIEEVEKKGIYYINDMPFYFEDEEQQGYNIIDLFFQGSENFPTILGKKFCDNSINTQFKKVRNYFKQLEL